ncbi:MAG: UDP-N-acetylmuramate dehydrogenase [Rickettsiaceae bacterium H1]|nr:UDP-N-acetylmuramate dehydrogenase [Rickettsiaceae bacterium H1]
MKIRKNVHLKNCTWMGVGGPADILLKPSNTQDLINFIKTNTEKITTIGVGSNILVSDSGIRGVVIKLGRGFTGLSCQANNIMAGAAVLDSNLAKFALKNQISGFEFFSGIPGTVGGALAMNAGCYESDTSSILSSAKVIDGKGNILNLTAREINYVYRGNRLPKNWIFIEGTFSGIKGKKSEIKAKMEKITQARILTQPIKNKTCGSIFKNPPGYKAWELIKQVGFRGSSLGDAEISDLHCNFVINKGNATSLDIENLCEQVRNKVKQIKGVDLEWEIVRLGN